MRRQANVRAVGLRPRNLYPSRMPRVLEYIEGNNGLCVSGQGGAHIRRGVRPQHARRGRSRNLGGPRLSSKKPSVERRADDPSPTHDTFADARVVGLTRRRTRVRHEGGHSARGTRAVADGGRESAGGKGAMTPGNGLAPGPGRAQACPCRGARQEGIMANALTWEDRSLGLLQGVERAQREPEGRFHSLAHLINVPVLKRAYRRNAQIRPWAWMGSRMNNTDRTWRPTSKTCTPG